MHDLVSIFILISYMNKEFTNIVADKFHSGTLEAMLQACEQSHGIHLTLHDHVGFFKGPDGLALLPKRKIHWHPACQLGRQQSFSHCNAFCNGRLPQQAAAGACFVSHCWKGLEEIIIPLQRYEMHVATLYAGAWLNPQPPPLPENVSRQNDIISERERLPRLNTERAMHLSKTLRTWVEGLMDICEEIQGINPLHQNRGDQIKSFIFKNAHQHISLSDLGSALGCSASRASHLCREALDTSFQELVLHERCQRACVLLSASPSTIAEIAAACGFGDVYYFSRAFKKRVGMPPGQYRKQHHAP